jgi:hypothetical protein
MEGIYDFCSMNQNLKLSVWRQELVFTVNQCVQTMALFSDDMEGVLFVNKNSLWKNNVFRELE